MSCQEIFDNPGRGCANVYSGCSYKDLIIALISGHRGGSVIGSRRPERMPSSGMLRRMALVRTKVSEERFAFIMSYEMRVAVIS
jgi:hypothetical protein